jgi:large subunit ribosomal protein L6
MSRIGKKPIPLPSGVKIQVGEQLEVTGPKGKLLVPIPEGITFEQSAGKLEVKRASDSHAALHGLTRALAANAVHGVSAGFTRELDIVGIGYRADVKGNVAIFTLGYSHPIEVLLPPGVDLKNRQGDGQRDSEFTGAPGAERVRPAVAGTGGGKHSRASLAGSLQE